VSGTGEMRAGAAGVIRVYGADASADDLTAALEEVKQTIAAVPGLIRFNLVRLPNNAAATFSSFDTQEHTMQLAQVAKDTCKATGSNLQKVFPKDPEQIDVTLLDVFAP
jgi:hypothetical protein